MKHMIVGTAVTGAKFTPRNHRRTRSPLLDAAASGATIKHRLTDVVEEAKALSDLGARYWHFHARNPRTNEQSTDNRIYQHVSTALQEYDNSVAISFGASRNGEEVKESIRTQGEWERVSQSALPLHLGGAHFVTTQAAVELQIVMDLERQNGRLTRDFVSSPSFSEVVRAYVPSVRVQPATIEVFSTTHGSSYGSTSAATQLATLRESIRARNHLYLPHEIEWVQRDRSYAATRFSILDPKTGLGSSGQLNVTLLFGFSPDLPFPKTFDEFLDVVMLAKSLEEVGPNNIKLRVSISVGAAVIPQRLAEVCVPMDVGEDSGKVVGPLQRIVGYACQPNAPVDIIRAGLEDTPFRFDPENGMSLATNEDLVADTIHEMHKHGYLPLTNKDQVFETLHAGAGLGRYREDMARIASEIERAVPAPQGFVRAQ